MFNNLCSRTPDQSFLDMVQSHIYEYKGQQRYRAIVNGKLLIEQGEQPGPALGTLLAKMHTYTKKWDLDLYARSLTPNSPAAHHFLLMVRAAVEEESLHE